jgi:hypothetical protein
MSADRRRWPQRGLSGGALAVAIVALAISGALAGTAMGARVAAEAAPPAEPASDPAAQKPLPPQLHSVLGRVVATRGEFLRVRTPDGTVVRVHVLPRALIRKAGKRVELEAIERGDRVLAVGRVNQNGVLQARAVRAQPTPASRPQPSGEATPDEGPQAPSGTPPAESQRPDAAQPPPEPEGRPASVPPAIRTALALRPPP